LNIFRQKNLPKIYLGQDPDILKNQIRIRSKIIRSKIIRIQCCQLLANVYGQNNRQIRLLAKKFGRTHYLLLEADIIIFYKESSRTIVRKKSSK
jgi:hypothetical protein